MKFSKIIQVCILAFLVVTNLKAQNVDEIISNYEKAIGGKEVLNKINSVYMENSVEIMGNESINKMVILNGKGTKTVTEMMGKKMIQCYTDKGGWLINPLTGNSDAIDMPLDQYNSGKTQLFITDPIIDYRTKGYKVELLGSEKLGESDQFKLQLTGVNDLTYIYYIDKITWLISKMDMSGKMMGQDIKMVTLFKEYKKTEQGMSMPSITEISYNEQFKMTMKLSKIDFNKPIDINIFTKGNLDI